MYDMSCTTFAFQEFLIHLPKTKKGTITSSFLKKSAYIVFASDRFSWKE